MRTPKTPRLGQHFLRDRSVVAAMVAAARLTREDTVLEIGPGHGVLTRELLARARKVIAVEKDAALVAELRKSFAEEIASQKLVLVKSDIRDQKPPDANYKLIANIPYYLTGEIIRTFLELETPPSCMALLVQQEVAERIMARDGKESLLSLSVKAYGSPRIVKRVKAGAFFPTPKVDSVVLLVENISKDFFRNTDITPECFFRVLHAGFAHKRKKLLSNLALLCGKDVAKRAFERCAIAPHARAEELTLPQWAALAGQCG